MVLKADASRPNSFDPVTVTLREKSPAAINSAAAAISEMGAARVRLRMAAAARPRTISATAMSAIRRR